MGLKLPIELMDSSSCIDKRGVIEEISDGKASVIFSNASACVSCDAKGVCELFGPTSRKIVVPVDCKDFSVGESVDIVMKRSIGMNAAIIAYLIPFILLILALLIGTHLKLGDLTVGLVCIILLSFYFIGLYFFRHRIKKAFTFIIQKTS